MALGMSTTTASVVMLMAGKRVTRELGGKVPGHGMREKKG